MGHRKTRAGCVRCITEKEDLREQLRDGQARCRRGTPPRCSTSGVQYLLRGRQGRGRRGSPDAGGWLSHPCRHGPRRRRQVRPRPQKQPDGTSSRHTPHGTDAAADVDARPLALRCCAGRAQPGLPAPAVSAATSAGGGGRGVGEAAADRLEELVGGALRRWQRRHEQVGDSGGRDVGKAAAGRLGERAWPAFRSQQWWYEQGGAGGVQALQRPQCPLPERPAEQQQ
mmetsp:Transcript_30156/g.96251  ORF Transcript_30156/g.96251 Transcript_30156/m.96251 type:complete len:227 (+) Transcript_30156:812-1492(+)